MALETICVAEEKKDYQRNNHCYDQFSPFWIVKKAFLDKLVVGEEMEYEDLIREVAVKNHRI